jgi:hypothetical protein
VAAHTLTADHAPWRARSAAAAPRGKLSSDAPEDDADSIAWAATLPGSSGRVGIYGFSYQCAAQTLALL